MTVLATTPPDIQDLAEFSTTLQLGDTEPLGIGVKRVTMEQLQHAASGFFDLEGNFGEAVHESRKSIKRVRALLRLVRGELPNRVFAFENKSLRDTARLLAEIRAAQGVVDAVTSIRDLYGDLLATGTFVELVEKLSLRRDLIELKAVEDPNLIGRVVRSLERAFNRYQSWPTDPEAREVYGLGIRDSIDAMRPGLTRTYDTGRQAMVRAYRRAAPGDFHDWRKRVKDMRHQMEFLVPLWPEVVVGMAITLQRLGDILGEDNDLAEAASLVRGKPDLCPDPRERSLFAALANQRRREYQDAAEILGRRIYAERPASMSSRFGEYWDARLLSIREP